MPSSIGTVTVDDQPFGYVRIYETPSPPVVHGVVVWTTEAELEAHWGESDWGPHACGAPAEAPGRIEGECYGPDEWPVTVCRSCRRIVDGFQPREQPDGG